MNTDRHRALRRATLLGLLAIAAAGASAQRLPGAAPGQALPPPPGQAGTGLPGVGSGPGFHDPRSAFKPLEEREGVVSWSLLSSVSTRAEKNRLVPVFPQPVKALHGKTVTVQGFMMPLEPGDKQKHFLLSAVPTSCSFCVPAGPEGLIEVRSRAAVTYTLDPVVVRGKMSVLPDDPFGVYYRVVDAQPVK